MRPLGLIELDVVELCAEAGGDPWKIDDALQTGDTGAINDLAEAFYGARNHVDEADDDFDKAKRKFQNGYRRNGTEHPVNDSAEVARVTARLGGHREQLSKIAVNLEQVAAALVTAQRESDADITAVNRGLDEIDTEISRAKTANQNTSALRDQAVKAVEAALQNVTAVRGDYVKQLRQAETAMAVSGYSAEVIEGFEGLPATTPTQRASEANERTLRAARARTQDELHRLQREFGTMLATDHDWNQGPLKDLAARIQADKDRLAEFDAIDDSLRRAPEIYTARRGWS